MLFSTLKSPSVPGYADHDYLGSLVLSSLVLLPCYLYAIDHIILFLSSLHRVRLCSYS